MKNENGITLVSLITYIIGMILIMAIIASILSYYNKNMAGINNSSDINLELNKFNSRMIKETKEAGNTVEEVTETTIKFSNGNVYTFADNKIYLGKVQISKYVNEFSARLETEGEKQLLKVYILIGKGTEELAQNFSYTIEGTVKQEGGLTQVGKLERPKSAPWTGEIATSFARGTGTKTNPYIIETPEQLAYLASTTNAGNTHEGEYFKITYDLDLGGEQLSDGTWTGQNWTPIGTSSNHFRGNIDGNNCEISNLYINSIISYIGLFGYITSEESEIKNISIVSGYIKTTSTHAGSIVGMCSSNSASILNCKSAAYVEGTQCVGGIAAWTNGLTKNCEFSGAIVGSGYFFGGIVGYYYGSNATEIESSCVNTGTINGNTGGAIIGRIDTGSYD